jgi:MFS family permease
MRQTTIQLSTPTISLIAIMLGNGLLSTLVPLRLQIEGYSEIVIGIIGGSYYAGMMIGAFKIEPVVSRVGHIRAYAVFASLLSVVTLMQGMFLGAISWFLLRLLTGCCMAGIFVVIESWFLAVGDKKSRGRLLALYMAAMYTAQSGGQFLLYLGDIGSLQLFCIINILICLSITPLSMTKIVAPQIDEPSTLSLFKLYKISPSGVLGSFAAGVILSSLYSLFPIYVIKVGYKVDSIALIMGLLILGGMSLQYPMGKISDLFDRRKILVLLCTSISIISILLIIASYITSIIFLILCTAYGGLVFILYPLSINQTCDYVKHQEIVGTTQGLLLSYGIGAVIGPIISALFMQFHHIGLLLFIGVLSISLSWFIHYRGKIHVDLPLEQQQDFIISSNTTPIASNMDPSVGAKLKCPV